MVTKKILFRKSWSRAYTYTFYMPDKHGICKCIETNTIDKTVISVSKISIHVVARNVKKLVGDIIDFEGVWSCSIYMCDDFDKIMEKWVH